MKTNFITVGLFFGLTLIYSNKNVIAQDNLGNHIATQNLNMSNYEIDNVSFLDFRSGANYGIRFWGGQDNYSIKMGTSGDYMYGPVSSYAIKFNMWSNAANKNRGWTWGTHGQTPVAALNAGGTMQLAKDLYVMEDIGIGTTSPSYKLHILNSSLSSGTAIRADALNGHIRLFETDGASPSTHFTQIERNSDAFNIHQYNGSTYQHVLTAKMDGNVGIGTNSPGSLLDVKNSSLSSGGAIRAQAINGQIRIFETDGAAPTVNFTQIERNGDAFHIYQKDAVGYKHVLTATTDGNVGIGTTNPHGYKLAVKGNMIAESVVVKLFANWPDYVFTEKYGLMELDEVESYIKENSHLPNVPSAKEVEENGIDLGKMDAVLLQKIEELTLYVIELKKEIEVLKKK